MKMLLYKTACIGEWLECPRKTRETQIQNQILTQPLRWSGVPLGLPQFFSWLHWGCSEDAGRKTMHGAMIYLKKESVAYTSLINTYLYLIN